MNTVHQIRPGYYGERNQRPKPPPRFIYELPFREHKEIEDLLNMNDSWEILAGDHLGFTLIEIDKIRRYNQKPGESAARALLDFLEQRNTLILDLYLYLNKIQLYRGMDILKQYVPSKHHLLIRSGPQLELISCDPVRTAVEAPTLPAAYILPQKIAPNHYRPPSPPPTASTTGEETRSQNLTTPVVANRVNAVAGGFLQRPRQPPSLASVRAPPTRPAEIPPVDPIAGTYFPNLPVKAPSSAGTSPTIGGHGGGGGGVGSTCSSVPGHNDVLQQISFRNQQGVQMQDYNPYRRRNISETTISSVGSSMVSGVPHVPITDLGLACNNWAADMKIGEGGYGEVYRGEWRHQAVAIKRIRRDKYSSYNEAQYKRCIDQCIQEIIFLNRLKSEFIIPILAYSESFDPCIVYQFMPNGSLFDRLKKKNQTPALSWQQRYWIALGCANGLQFLHSTTRGDKKLVHGDIKSANILLDQNFQPKIGDFGLAQEIEMNESKVVLTSIFGTPFYLPNDFLRDKQLNGKVDTYSFGVVLFDLVTGKPPNYRVNPESKTVLLDVMKQNEPDFGTWVDKSWPEHLKDIQISAILYKFGKWCARDRKKERPEMEEVYLKLKSSLRKESMGSPSPLELQLRYDSLEQVRTEPRAQSAAPESDLIQFLTSYLEALPPLGHQGAQISTTVSVGQPSPSLPRPLLPSAGPGHLDRPSSTVIQQPKYVCYLQPAADTAGSPSSLSRYDPAGDVLPVLSDLVPQAEVPLLSALQTSTSQFIAAAAKNSSQPFSDEESLASSSSFQTESRETTAEFSDVVQTDSRLFEIERSANSAEDLIKDFF